MFRGTTVCARSALIAAVLLALSVFTPTASFATAHTPRQAEAKALPGIKLSAKAQRNETTTHGNCDAGHDPTGPLRTRDRPRAVDFAPEGPERPLAVRDTTTDGDPVASDALRLSRPSAAHSPAALQVFRC